MGQDPEALDFWVRTGTARVRRLENREGVWGRILGREQESWGTDWGGMGPGGVGVPQESLQSQAACVDRGGTLQSAGAFYVQAEVASPSCKWR